jgi:hypothetical protein
VTDTTEELAALVAEAWDDGNATGLDGYVGPGRGAGEVDPEAVYARDRILAKANPLLHETALPIAERVFRQQIAEEIAVECERRAEMQANSNGDRHVVEGLTRGYRASAEVARMIGREIGTRLT